MSFEYTFSNLKKITFDSTIEGLVVANQAYFAGDDGILIYDKVDGLESNYVICQLSTNTSTFIPALRILGISYNPYFDSRDAVDSQNDIRFYWKPSRLAAFYNRYSTDGIDLEKREPIIKKAIEFLISTAENGIDFLPEEKLKSLDEGCKLLGFYEGFPIFDARFGLPQLKSRLGIHVGTESILVSTPFDRYSTDIVELAIKIEKETGQKGTFKKNRVRFENSEALIKELGL